MLLDFALYLLSILVSVPLVVFAVECLAALPRSRARVSTDRNARPPIAVVVPAHDEQEGIGQTVGLIRAQLRPGDRLLVVADNCSDRTAEVARSAGAEVLVRESNDRRGKGYALAAGLEELQAEPAHQAVVFLDADSIPGPGLLDGLAEAALASGRPVQSCYLFDPPANSTPRDRISALAILFKNRVRLLGLSRLSDASHITGTGFAFPSELIRPESFASGHLTEDMELGLLMASRGRPPLYRDDLRVHGVLPSGESASKTQRTRWEHGHLALLLKRGPKLLLGGLRSFRWSAVALALDLLVPPLSLLFLLAGAGVAVSVLVAILDAYRAPLTILLTATTFALLAFLAAWARYGRSTIGFGELMRLPLYVFWKIPLYLRFLFRPEKKWVRTARDPAAPTD